MHQAGIFKIPRNEKNVKVGTEQTHRRYSQTGHIFDPSSFLLYLSHIPDYLHSVHNHSLLILNLIFPEMSNHVA